MLEHVLWELCRAPVSVGEAKSLPKQGGVPDEAGLYAWWVLNGALSEVPYQARSSDAALGLLYVGIAPGKASSSATLRSRILSNHISGNIASSTFRFTLASLLVESMGWVPRATATKTVLVLSDNRALSAWQRENLKLSWSVRERPWEVEGAVIAELRPPLNLAANSDHPFARTLSEARARLRATAKNAPNR